MLLEEILKQEQERFIKENLLSDEMIELLKENIMPFNTLMAYYRCAIMEVETKFKVLNEEFSLQYDRNPIESIKSRIKSMDGIFKKAKKKNIPITMEGIEEGISGGKSNMLFPGRYLYACRLPVKAGRCSACREKGLYQES